MPHKGVKLVSMKLDPKKIEEEMKPKSITESAPAYPWGLTVRLNDDALDALGMSKLPSVGATLYLGANVKVVSVSANENTDGDGGTRKNRSVELQITEMGLGKPEGSAEDTLYSE